MNKAGEELLTRKEQIRLTAYICPAGKPTIGRGHTEGVTMEMVKARFTITAAEEQAQFKTDMEEWTNAVRVLLTRKPNENQLSAMVCLAYNIGIGSFKKSTVLRCFERGDDAAAAKAFGLFDKIRDPVSKELVVSNGLVLRRAEEAALFLTPVGPEKLEPMPQDIAPEKPMSSSTINRSAIIGGGTAAIATITETVNSVNSLKASVTTLGDWLVAMLLVVTICCAGYIVWQRYNLRNRGQA